MTPGIYDTPFVYVRNIVTKIILLTRLFRSVRGDIVLYSKSYAVQLVAFIAAYSSNKTLHLLDSMNEVGNIIMDRKVSIILLDSTTNFDLRFVSYHIYSDTLDLVAGIDLSELVSVRSNFEFLYAKAINEKFRSEFYSLTQSSFKDEQNFFKEYNQPRIGDIPLLTINQEGKRVPYFRSSVWHMCQAIDSEFKDSPVGLISLKDTSFKQTFAYALYFFLRGDVLDVISSDAYFESIKFAETKLKHKVFVSDKAFDNSWHTCFKYTFFNRVNRFLRRWKVTKWLTIIGYTKAFKNHVQTPIDEYIIINHQRTQSSLEFLKRVRRKISFIFGTYADGYTLSINRYDDKKLKIQDSKFRVMGKDIKIEKDTINKMFISGARIPPPLLTKHPVNVKDRNDLYHITEYYCDISGEILTVRASSEDLYYEDEGNAIIDVGTKRRSLMEVPFLRRVDVFKHEGRFICVAQLDKSFIKKHFENPKLSDAIARLREKVDELNSVWTQYGKINKIIVLDKFFDEYDSMNHIISKKDYIRFLNLEPSNLPGTSRG